MRLKKDKDEYSFKVRERVIFVMKNIIMNRKDIRTRSAFAIRIGTTSASVNRWEEMNGYPTVENIANICYEFAVSPDYLIMGKGNMHGDAEVIVRLINLEKRVKELEKEAGIKSPRNRYQSEPK